MKLYPMERLPKFDNFANSMHFKTIKNFDPYKGGFKMNKDLRITLKKVNVDLQDWVTNKNKIWLDKNSITDIKNKLKAFTEFDSMEKNTVSDLICFLDICIIKGYDVKMY